MKNRAADAQEIRKIWIAPKLKRIDVQEVTANGGDNNYDGFLHS